jgi:hypothetical protein
MYMVEVVTVTDRTTVMATTLVDLPIWVDRNHHHTDNLIIPTDTNLTQRGVQAETDPCMATVAREVVKVSS